MLTSLVAHPTVLALAGRGSSGFSGGRSSGGGFSGGGSGRGYGGGGFFFIGGGSGGAIILVIIVVAVILFYVVPRILKAADKGATAQKKRATAREREAREAAILPAALEAAMEDSAFDPDDIRAAASGLVIDTQEAWDTRDRERLKHLVGPDLLREWTRRLDDFDRRGWHAHAGVSEAPIVKIVGITNREGEDEDQVVVHIKARAQSWVETRRGETLYEDGASGPEVTLSQYWTLGRREGRWILVSIEEEGEGDHNLSAPVLARPDADPLLSDRVRTEMAAADTAGDAVAVAELVPAEMSDDARTVAMDLSLVDDRFSPDVLTAAVRAAVGAWTTAIDGSDDQLERLATPDAVQRLLYGGDDKIRTVVRGPRIDEVVIDRVDGSTAPPRIEVSVRHHARWYREDRDTQAVVEGSRTKEVARAERWTFRLDDDAERPWLLVGV
ncbi:TIM44-like domain-containing protein [Patulibacter minatonensis]|uniref:TIM44-like domain-containing protein n=1 Tax=Patulibacter minatonensis TaxID=298163 RepID=UPI0004789551|nr:TIM44-like domain-containing protein [Patulibacter minatonensis]